MEAQGLCFCLVLWFQCSAGIDSIETRADDVNYNRSLERYPQQINLYKATTTDVPKNKIREMNPFHPSTQTDETTPKENAVNTASKHPMSAFENLIVKMRILRELARLLVVYKAPYNDIINARSVDNDVVGFETMSKERKAKNLQNEINILQAMRSKKDNSGIQTSRNTNNESTVHVDPIAEISQENIELSISAPANTKVDYETKLSLLLQLEKVHEDGSTSERPNKNVAVPEATSMPSSLVQLLDNLESTRPYPRPSHIAVRKRKRNYWSYRRYRFFDNIASGLVG